VIERLHKVSDAAISAALGIASFVLLFIRYWVPPDKIFDEIYFARAAEEYLQRRYIYENTHPPTTKLLVTLSVIMFGGLHGGDNAWGWRFLNVVAGAVAVPVLFVLAKRITRSTLFGFYAALLFACDGMHYVQSRIATPEAFVVVFSMLTVYAFCRYWDAVSEEEPKREPSVRPALIAGGIALACGAAIGFLRFRHEILAAQIIVFVVVAAAVYAAVRIYQFRPPGWRWLVTTAVAGALLVTSKWYGVMAYGMIACVVGYAAIRATRTRQPASFPVLTVAATLIGAAGVIYTLAYIPHFIGLRDLPQLAPRPYTVSDVVTMQVNAFLYHDHLRATHPYASVWYTWPVDWRPLLYSAVYAGSGPDATAAMIYSFPNPILLWAGLITVPLTGVLAIRERNRGYGLVVLAYLLQWLPWMFSPRIAFIYHFYVDIPLIAICTAVAMQWLLRWMQPWDAAAARWIVAGYAALVVLSFIYFFPILSSITIHQSAWLQRLWLPSWRG
jgi:dolichyl-phosphate-mannose-protein mannosyltransferase